MVILEKFGDGISDCWKIWTNDLVETLLLLLSWPKKKGKKRPVRADRFSKATSGLQGEV